MLLANTPAQTESLLHSLEQASRGTGLHVNANKTEYMCFKQEGAISTQSGEHLKLVDKFISFSSSVLSTERDVTIRLAKAWTALGCLSIMWKSDLSDEIKKDFLHALAAPVLLYHMDANKTQTKKLDSNYTRLLRAIWNKYWEQHPTKQRLSGHLPLISKTIQVKRTRHAAHGKDKLISDFSLWNPTHGWPARTLQDVI